MTAAKKKPVKVTPPAPRKRRSAGDWAPMFLASLALSGNVRRACEDAGVARQHAYDYRDRSPAFRLQWKEAMAEAVERLEECAHGRATVGFQDKKRKLNLPPSDGLLKFLLAAHGGEKYRQAHSVKHSGDPANPLKLELKAEHDHRVDPAALAAFAADLAAAGLGGVPADGGAEPVGA